MPCSFRGCWNHPLTTGQPISPARTPALVCKYRGTSSVARECALGLDREFYSRLRLGCEALHHGIVHPVLLRLLGSYSFYKTTPSRAQNRNHSVINIQFPLSTPFASFEWRRNVPTNEFPVQSQHEADPVKATIIMMIGNLENLLDQIEGNLSR